MRNFHIRGLTVVVAILVLFTACAKEPNDNTPDNMLIKFES